LGKPTTLVVNSRCDIRSFATLHKYFFQKGYGNLNMSQLLRLVADEFADLVVANGFEGFDSSFEAASYIDQVRVAVPSGNRKSLVEQIQKETLLADGFQQGPSSYGQPAPKKVEPSLVDRARKLMTKAERTSSTDPESLDQAVKRREQEAETSKQELGKLPK
jgi:hypothetical protein